MKKHYAYIIKWRDSTALRGWNSIDGDHSVSEIMSVGWLVKQTPKTLTLTTSLSNHGNVMDALTIPKESIVKSKRLKFHMVNR